MLLSIFEREFMLKTKKESYYSIRDICSCFEHEWAAISYLEHRQTLLHYDLHGSKLIVIRVLERR